jgi:excisionase family DNA binding protein
MPKYKLNTHPGYYTTGELAKHLGISFNTLKWWVKQGKLPDPALRVGGKQKRLYSESQAEEIRRLLK